MPNKHVYFAIGCSAGSYLSYLIRKHRKFLYKKVRLIRKLYSWDRDWFLYFPVIIGFSGMYALIPDILHALRILPKEVTRGDFFNVFFFHSYFEKVEDSNQMLDYWFNTLGSISLFCIALGIFYYYIKQLK